MNKRVQGWVLMVVLTLWFAGPSPAADEVSIAKDLTAVVALLGLPCGKVVSVVKKGDNDHAVTCQDGNHYRVFVNAEGRVVAEKQ